MLRARAMQASPSQQLVHKSPSFQKEMMHGPPVQQTARQMLLTVRCVPSLDLRWVRLPNEDGIERAHNAEEEVQDEGCEGRSLASTSGRVSRDVA
eukprot:CAMPEP_0170572472 /NCGR_PEP_ID=MMETSP0224-20130122/2234_1 /TAXON_ID=285029 /ORGANISM="Togula jolla, Strain CCCM 725" /LENGTH=94 /DNA_ID=CAMNT_0010894963 /DNA_START=232 /DNA_END=516 /DNA_ORIENTATION=+